MRIGCTHDRCLEQTVVLIYTHQGLCDEDYEAEVILWCLARTMEQDAGISGQTPVVVLAGTVDACEWLLMEKYAETVMASQDRKSTRLNSSHVSISYAVFCLKKKKQTKKKNK